MALYDDDDELLLGGGGAGATTTTSSVLPLAPPDDDEVHPQRIDGDAAGRGEGSSGQQEATAVDEAALMAALEDQEAAFDDAAAGGDEVSLSVPHHLVAAGSRGYELLRDPTSTRKHKSGKKSSGKKRHRTHGDDDGDDDENAADEGPRKKRRGSDRRAHDDEPQSEYVYELQDTDMLSEEAAERTFAATNTVPLVSAAGASKKGGAKKPSKIEMLRIAKEEASALVEKMRRARQQDEAARKSGAMPLFRVRLCDEVKLTACRVHVHEALVESGFLDEICLWLADRSRRELAPLNLRQTALEVLGHFALEGVQCGKMVKSKKVATSKLDPADGEDIETWAGISDEQLKKTDLGWATAFVLRHKDELPVNKDKASRLLENFSRLFHGVVNDGSSGSAGVQIRKEQWRHFGDPSILAPFELLRSEAERFQAAFTKVDPLDPSSYNRVPPIRTSSAYVTSVFLEDKQHKKQQQAQKDAEEEDEA